MKDENVTDVLEWLTYYRWLGVQHVLLTDNDSVDYAETAALLRKTFPEDFLTLRTYEGPRPQMPSYAWCLEEYRPSFDWIAFFDVDEYLVLLEDSVTLPSLLDTYKMQGGLSVHWVFVGPNSRQTRPESGGVLPYYPKCVVPADLKVKTIVNTYWASGLTTHPHNFVYRDDKLSVTELNKTLPWLWRLVPGKRVPGVEGLLASKHCLQLPTEQREKECYRVAPPFVLDGYHVQPGSAEKVALFHYATKSFEDFGLKMKRGSGMSNRKKDMGYLANIERRETFDTLCDKPAQLASQCCAHLYTI